MNPYLIFFLGLLLYKVIALIPVIGWLFASITTLIGIGALVTQKRLSYQHLRKHGDI